MHTLITWFTLAVLFGLSATPAIAQQPLEASLTFDSEANDYIGAGQSASYGLDTASFTSRSSNNGGHVGLTILGFNGDWWYLDFSAPAGTQLSPGAYEDAVRYPFRDVNQPGLSFSGNGRGCNTLTVASTCMRRASARMVTSSDFTRPLNSTAKASSLLYTVRCA
jgi:hypothetical protein